MPLKLMLLLGDHARHAFLARKLRESRHQLAGIICQQREATLPEPPDQLSERDRALFVRHFEARSNAEQRYLGNEQLPDVPTLHTSARALNSEETAAFVRDRGADAALVFGTALIRAPLLTALPSATLNLHLGLSPRYRGAAGLFWPFYFLEPAWAGATFHYLEAEPDAGDVVHQCVPTLERGDGIHDVACRTIAVAAHEALLLLDRLEADRQWPAKAQRSTGRNFLARDFHPTQLRVIYELYDDDIVRAYLDGELPERHPILIRHPGLTT